MHIKEGLKDALKEIINIGVGKAAGTLNDLLNKHIVLEVPNVNFISLEEMDHTFGAIHTLTVSAVRLKFRGSICGLSSLVFPPESAAKLVDMLVGEVPITDDLDAIKVGALSEVGNIILNAVMASFGDLLDTRLIFSIPVYVEGKISSVFNEEVKCPTPVISATAKFTVEEHQIYGEIILLLEIGAFDVLSTAVIKKLEI
jgi:chemotaxis protein CheC